VKKIINFFRLSIERFLSKLGLGMRAKLIIPIVALTANGLLEVTFRLLCVS
jgi:hypothetical protein